MLLGYRGAAYHRWIIVCLDFPSMNFGMQELVVRHVFGKRQNDPHKQIAGPLAQLEMPNTRLIMHRDAVLTILGKIETWRGSTEEPPCLYPGANLKPNATDEQQH